MAESYLVRRGAGGGGTGKLNIFYGDTPPTNEVGVFCQTTNPVSNIYVEADPMATGENTWNPVGSYISNVNSTFKSCIYHDGTMFTLYSTAAMTRFDPYSQTYSDLESHPNLFNNGYWIHEWDNLIVKIGGWRTVKNSGDSFTTSTDSKIYAYDISSNTWTSDYKTYPVIDANYSVIRDAKYVGNGLSVYVYSEGTQNPDGYIYIFDIESELNTLSYKWNLNYSPIKVYGYVIFQDEYYVYSGMYRTSNPTYHTYRTDIRTLNTVEYTMTKTGADLTNNFRNGMSVNGESYVLQSNNGVYKADDDTNSSYTFQYYLSNYDPAFHPTMIDTFGTKAYGVFNNRQFVWFGQDTNNYEANSIIVVSGGQNNKAELISGNSPVEINVMTSYYWDGTSLTELSTQVRTSDTAWIAI